MDTRINSNGHEDGRKDAVANALGWFSIGLGTAQLVAPAAVERLIGLKGDRRGVMRLIGAREVASGVGILAQRRPAPWLWGRVAGDAMDLALLGRAFADAQSRRRVTGAIAAVAGVTVPDLLESMKSTAQGPVRARAAITVRRPIEAVYSFWRDLANLPQFMIHLESVEEDGNRSRWRATAPGGRTVEWEAEIVDERPNELLRWRGTGQIPNEGTVRFVEAPGNRGTEIHVSLAYEPPAGELGALVAKVFGEEPQTQIKDDLRRFKQMMETGEIVVSDGSPAGVSAKQQMRQRPAQPQEVAA
jgi:uncharacterized membrane protein